MLKCITQQGLHLHLTASLWLSLPVRSSSNPSFVFLTCFLWLHLQTPNPSTHELTTRQPRTVIPGWIWRRRLKVFDTRNLRGKKKAVKQD